MARRTDKRWKILPRGIFKGKKVTFASTDEVEAHDDIASEFMSTIFDLDPGDHLTTEESDTSDIWSRIEGTYGINCSDVGSSRLVRIFDAIAQRRKVQ